MQRRRRRLAGWAAVAGGIASTAALAVAGDHGPGAWPDPDPGRPMHARRGGPIRRFFRHTSETIHDRYIGRPDLFVEPPLGYTIRENFGVNVARAGQHQFTLYRSDFLAGTTTLSPTGADRLTRLANRLGGWPGPVVVEWVPEEPELAGARRATVVAMLQGAGLPVAPDRVVVGPSAYPGQLGFDASNNIETLIYRDQLAPANYSLPPVDTTTFGAQGGR